MFELHTQLDLDCITLGDLPLSRVLLMNDARFPWCILVPRRENMQAIHQLDEVDQQQLIVESSYLSQVMLSFFQSNKINVAALGNVVPQLHVHHVARFDVDAAWPNPVWGVGMVRLYEEQKQQTLVAGLQSALGQSMSFVLEGSVVLKTKTK